MKKGNRKDELHLQMAIADYLRLQYPQVPFYSSMSGIRLLVGQAVENKKIQDGRKWPDVFIAEPRGGFYGLFGEIKLTQKDIYKTDGNYLNEHVAAQAEMLKLLNERGYRAVFWPGFDYAKEIIDWYLGEDLLCL